MKSSVFTKIFLVLALALVLGFGLAAPDVFAQSTDGAIEGLDTVGTTAGLSDQDPTIIVARIIRAGLGILGMIAMIILMYGGFLWMTAGGNEEKVRRAKRLIMNAGIGVAIILASLGITQLVLEALIDATNENGGGSVVDDTVGGGLGGGSGSVFAVTKHMPTGQVPIRNVVPQITFSKTLDAATVTSENIRFVYAEGEVEIPGTLTVNGNRVSFVPATPCPEPNADRFCFNENAVVNVAVDNAIESSTGVVLSCANNLCASSFTTGSVVDIEDPEARLEAPDSGESVPSESLVDVQVSATDDAQVAAADFAAGDLVFDSVPASGDNLTNVLIETVWDTAGLLNGSTYRLTATVVDIAGNTDEDSVTVRMRPPTCFNNVIDGIETGLNCGGDSASADYCGACDGSSCSADDECSSGVCDNGICVSLPVIDSITPPDGMPGTWVTVRGRNFGNFTGTVSFTGAAGPIAAEFASCATTWTNTQIFVVVPEGAVDGPITVSTSNGRTDSTFDDNGPLIADFDVNNVSHPGLCDVNPERGAADEAVTLSGVSFGGDRGGSTVTFGSTEAGSYTAWSATSLNVTVPSLPNGDYAVAVNVDGVPSNTVNFEVSSAATSAPVITTLSPNTGGEGQYVTISGANFGSGVGTVWFENPTTQERILADTESFPDACAEDFWSNQAVTVIVPDGLDLGAYDLVLIANGQESNAVSFTVTNAQPTPGLCAIEPPNAAAGEAVTLHGANFGGNQGSVTFTANRAAQIEEWSNDEILVTVPNAAVTGAVVVRNAAGASSNPVNFEVSTDGSLAAAGALAAYAWSFSSGLIPDAPEMIFECSERLVSGVPNDNFDNGEGVCVNATVYAAFNMPMNEATLNQGSLEECIGGGNNPCAETREVGGTYYTTSRSVRFEPANDLRPSTTYVVTSTDRMLSAEGAPLSNPQSWTFTTRADATPCRIEQVIVAPDEATIRELNGTQDFEALPVQGCTVLRDQELHWSWSVNQSYARLDTASNPACQAGDSMCALVEALAEGVTPVRATETRSRLFDEATLTIDFSDPYVTNYWPNCTEACVNAEVGASFNASMSQASVEAAGAVQLYLCANELCTSLQPVSDVRVACTYDADGRCTGFAFSELNLAPQSFYRVIVDGDIRSTSGVALTRTNYAGDFSWTFRVREDASLCAVDRISLSPSAVTVNQVGVQQTFTGEAYGEADSCSVSGQRLSGFSYSWNWTDPIADEDNDNDEATRVAEWKNGLVDSGIDGIPLGCTASCTAAGSMPQTAICGDGTVDYGEECEDGNVANGDGCSSSCLREGNSGPSCGDGVVRRDQFEDCDDGKKCANGLACSSDAECTDSSTCIARGGDGCSATCVAEGSDSIGATCGNNDVAVVSATTMAGEECDDGNAVRGDGCSNECLFEGSPTLSAIGGAVCGNGGVPELPSEQCEDGNTTDGDGCSSTCLWEGSSTRYGSVCGENGVEYGEACDDGNSVDGDGCSSECLREGSSTLYSEPSYCGDGVVGLGELDICEQGVSGDGNIDPIQVALVRDDAVMEVDPATQMAVATIEVTEVDSGLSTEATLSLLCSAENDTQCADPAMYGVGANNCCMARPEVTLFPNGGNVCRNSALYAIFTDEMDIADFAYEATEAGVTATRQRMYARLDLATVPNGICPADHTTLAIEPRNPVLRVWNKLVRLVTGQSANAAQGDCVAPIESYEQIAIGGGEYKVQMHLGAMLVANATYELVVEGDDDTADEITSGVTTKYGVGMNGTRFQTFTVGSEVCELDAVTVTDTDQESPYVFSTGEEQHTFLATPQSYATGIPQEIDSIEGVYSWEWSNWEDGRNEEIVSVEQVNQSLDTATVTAVGENGEDNVFATATIEDDVTNVSSNTSVTGSAPVLAFLCENPWPSPFASLPWSDTADGDQGAEEGNGWMNFSTMYCRDAGEDGSVQDLPDVTVVRPPVTESANVIKEYLYEVGGGSDAIGVRVVSNPDYLSAFAWYEAQGFTGDPSETQVDGYKAAKDGRTTYVVAPNQAANGDLYANVYVISYNEGASDDTIEIYNQMVDNFRFAINVSDAAVCDEADDVCSSSRDYLRRDTRRLTDLTDIRAAISEYRAVNSAVPTLPAGSFVRSLSSSVWESWNSILGGALGATLPTDPINDYVSCGATGFEAYDAETCVNETTGTYMCPANSQTYHYKSVGAAEAYLYADLEYTTGTWVNPIEEDIADGVTLSIGNSSSTASGFDAAAFCDGTSVFGASTTCGDGVVGGSEVCELGQLGGSTIACTTEGGLSGTRSQICNATCDGYTDNVAATCVVASCGNGILESENGEMCDDGSLNGTYGFCGNDCAYRSAFFCGDGELAGGEACDCGITSGLNSSDSRAFGAGAGSCGNNLNGVYASSPNASCSWDCSGPASYCGDGTVDAGEVCDGADETWSGKLCSQSSPRAYRNQPCVTNSDCGGGTCGGGIRAECPLGTTRVRTCNDNPGDTCTYSMNNWLAITCTEIGSCGDGVVDPGEECDDGNDDGTDSCTDQCRANVCGDGYVYVGEEQCDEGTLNGAGCDSAYGSSCTACSLSCRYEVTSGEFCGDGEINGTEYCDANSILPVWYNSSTGAMDGTCTTLDANHPNKAGFVCKNVGVCNGGGAAENGTPCLNSSQCGGGTCVFPTCNQSCSNTCPFTYSSVPLELTTNQPGADASSVANFHSYSEDSTSDLPNAATITVPACNVATTLSASVSLDGVDLPTTYILFVTDLSVTMGYEVGSSNFPDEEGEESRLQVAQDAMADAAEELFDKLGSNARIGAIGYRGLVEGQCFYEPRTSCTVDRDCENGPNPVPGDFCNQETSGVNGTFFGPDPFDFVGPEQEADLVDYTYGLTYDPISAGTDGHGTFTYEALEKAKEMFDDIKNSSAGDNARYIVILLSDGEVTDDSNYAEPNRNVLSPDPLLIAKAFDSYTGPNTAGYEIYSATLSNRNDWERNMMFWSSNSYDGREASYGTVESTHQTQLNVGTPREASVFNDLDYAYQANTEEDLHRMYDQIVDSIVEIAVTIVAEYNGVVEETQGFIEAGDNVELPWPSNFVCDDVSSQQVPIQISFPGTGMIQVSNVRLEYCAP